MKGGALRRGEDMSAAAGTGTDSAGAEGTRCAVPRGGGGKTGSRVRKAHPIPSGCIAHWARPNGIPFSPSGLP